MPPCAAAAASVVRKSQQSKKEQPTAGPQDLTSLLRQSGRDSSHGLGSDGAVELQEKPELGTIDDLTAPDPPAEVRGPSGRIYMSTSLFCLRPAMMPRSAAIFICESKPFDPIILVTILCNCTTMAWASPLDPTGTWKEAFLGVRAAFRHEGAPRRAR
eukprot:2604735-Prymnesium_polylepis.1